MVRLPSLEILGQHQHVIQGGNDRDLISIESDPIGMCV